MIGIKAPHVIDVHQLNSSRDEVEQAQLSGASIGV
jgi:hypothetical protein